MQKDQAILLPLIAFRMLCDKRATAGQVLVAENGDVLLALHITPGTKVVSSTVPRGSVVELALTPYDGILAFTKGEAL